MTHLQTPNTEKSWEERFNLQFQDLSEEIRGDLINWFAPELQTAREETIRECIEALPKKRVVDISDSRTIWQDEAFNLAIDLSTQNINNLDKE